MIKYDRLDETTNNVIDYAVNIIINELYDDIETDIKFLLKKSQKGSGWVGLNERNTTIGNMALTALENKLGMHYEYGDFISKELNAFYWGFLSDIKANKDVMVWLGNYLADEVAERQPENFWHGLEVE